MLENSTTEVSRETALDLAALRELSAKATPGPWRQHPNSVYVNTDARHPGRSTAVCNTDNESLDLRLADAAFIAAAVNFVRQQLAAQASAPSSVS